MTDPIALIIQRYLTGDISPEEEKALRTWLDASKSNRKMFESFKDANNIKADLTFFESINEDKAWRLITSQKGKSVRILNWKFLTVAASLAVVLSGFLLWTSRNESKSDDKEKISIAKSHDVAPASSGALLVMANGEKISLTGSSDQVIGDTKNVVGNNEELIINPISEPIPLTYNTLVIPKASYYKMTLSDGTKVWVNALSKLKFPVQFPKNERRVILNGEAYFEVSHNPAQPFIVEAEGTEIKVLGTHFNINSYNNQIRTTLAEGKVEVSQGDERMELEPGEYSLFADNQFIKGKADLMHDLAWHNNEFFFKKETIVDIAHQLSRWYDLDIKFRGNVQLDKKYTGSIERDVKLSQVLEMLSYVSDLRFEVDGRKLVISTRS
ncbi:FecR family protein [Sphingobacterium thalpophilum]|uniref:FecR family protein n=1 Tax=Sphingobacterium thalpophilum TaxID=259 RepID=UPI0037D9D024